MTQVGPFYNPIIPFKTDIPTLQDGTQINIQGYIPGDCNRFAINLKSGKGNVALHVNPRFEGTNQVVRNTKEGGSWGGEERDGDFPLVEEQNFECMILVTDYSYKIAFNGRHFTDYNHRLPMDEVKRLVVNGNVTVNMVQIYQPPSLDAAYAQAPAPVESPPEFFPVPYRVPYPYGMQPRKLITVTGVPNGDKFFIDMKTDDDIAFRFAVRLNQSVVVCNSKEGGSWMTEERNQPNFPFECGEQFTIMVLCEMDQYKVAVNGSHFIEFGHRFDLSQVSSMVIDGDVTLTNVQM